MSETNGPALADLMTSHVLELEADAAAANFSLNIALNRAWDDTIPPALLPSLATDKSRFQAWLFNPNKLAPTYPESAITKPFPFNGYYPSRLRVQAGDIGDPGFCPAGSVSEGCRCLPGRDGDAHGRARSPGRRRGGP